jgi:hypothetical protein
MKKNVLLAGVLLCVVVMVLGVYTMVKNQNLAHTTLSEQSGSEPTLTRYANENPKISFSYPSNWYCKKEGIVISCYKNKEFSGDPIISMAVREPKKINITNSIKQRETTLTTTKGNTITKTEYLIDYCDGPCNGLGFILYSATKPIGFEMSILFGKEEFKTAQDAAAVGDAIAESVAD